MQANYLFSILEKYLSHLPSCNLMQDFTEAFSAMADTPNELRDSDYNEAWEKLNRDANTCNCGLKEVIEILKKSITVRIPSMQDITNAALEYVGSIQYLKGNTLNERGVEKLKEFDKESFYNGALWLIEALNEKAKNNEELTFSITQHELNEADDPEFCMLVSNFAYYKTAPLECIIKHFSIVDINERKLVEEYQKEGWKIASRVDFSEVEKGAWCEDKNIKIAFIRVKNKYNDNNEQIGC